MGAFMGHVVPGVGFIVVALWWLYHILLRICRLKNRGIPFESKASYCVPIYCICTRRTKQLPVEALYKIAIPILGIIIESTREKVKPSNEQHMVMYASFGVTGIVDILMHFGATLPRGTDHAAFILANLIEMILYYFHLHGRQAMDVHVHMLLVYTLLIVIFICLLDMKYTNEPLAALAKSYIIFVKSWWYFQVGYILYNPSPWPGETEWFENSHKAITRVTIYYTINLTCSFLFYIIVATCFGVLYRVFCGKETRGFRKETPSKLTMQPLLSNTAQDSTVRVYTDDSEHEGF